MHYRIISSVLFLLPIFAYAAPTDFSGLVGELLSVINVLIPFVIGLTVVVFIWKVVGALILNSESEESVKKGKQIALWGVFVLFLMFAIWGILDLLQSTFFA